MNTFRAMRKGHRFTLKELHERCGLSISFLSDLEHGRTEASMETLRKLAECYGVSPATFLPNTTAQVPVPSFHVGQHILFACLRCGTVVQMNHMGKYHVSSSDHCPTCKAYYVAQWESPIEQSALMLVESEAAS